MSAKSSEDLRIVGPKDAIERLIRTAARYTDQTTGAPSYLKCILIEATSKQITVTAESSTGGAIQLIRDTKDIQVESPGTIMVQSNWLLTALAVTEPDKPVEIIQNSAAKRLTVKNGNQEVDLQLPQLADRVLKPSVGNPDHSNGVSFAPEQFAEVYNSASVARDSFGRRPVVAGVLMDTAAESELLRFMSTDGQGMTATDALPIEVIGDGVGQILLQDASVRSSLEYIKEGERAEMFLENAGSPQQRLHLLARGKGDTTPYHIRVATLDIPVDKYPASQIRGSLTKFVNPAGILGHVKMDKAELQRILRNASNIGSLDLINMGGQAKKISLQFSEDAVTASVNTSASYEGAAYAEHDLKDGLEFGFKFGLHGHIVDAYYNEADPKNIQFAILHRDGRVNAMLLYKGALTKEDGTTPSEYLSLTSLSAD